MGDVLEREEVGVGHIAVSRGVERLSPLRPEKVESVEKSEAVIGWTVKAMVCAAMRPLASRLQKDAIVGFEPAPIAFRAACSGVMSKLTLVGKTFEDQLTSGVALYLTLGTQITSKVKTAAQRRAISERTSTRRPRIIASRMGATMLNVASRKHRRAIFTRKTPDCTR